MLGHSCRGSWFPGLFRTFQGVTDTSDRLDHFKGILVVDLAAQVADVDVYDIGEAVVVHVPNVLHDHGAAQWAPAIAHHVFEDAEFFRREIDVLARPRNPPPDAVQRQVSNLKTLRHRLAAAE